MQIFRYLFILFLVINASVAINGQIQVKVKFSEMANLTYQLDCVSDLPINCSSGNLSELWNREFLKTEQDRAMLKEWNRLRELYAQNVRLVSPEIENSSYLDLFDKIRIAGLQANNIEDYAARLDLLTISSDRSSFERVIRHFQPQFDNWWKREALKSGGAFAKQTDDLLRSPKISGQIKQFYNFYAPILPPEYEINFNLFYIPDLIKEPNGGQQLQNYSLMEFKPNERPMQRIDVVIHELNHFFYDSMSAENKAKLKQRFYAANRAGAVPAYNLLNETLATALANGIIAQSVTPKNEFEKYIAARRSFYDNDAIDRAAKAVLPWLDEWLKNGKTINDAQFVPQYIANLEKAFGEDLTAPKLYLGEMFLFVDSKYGVSMRREVRKTLETTSFYTVEGNLANEKILDDFNNNPQLNSLFIVHPENIDELSRLKIISEAQAKQIRNEYDTKEEVLFNQERSPFTNVYLIIAKNSESAGKLVNKLANAKQFFGVYKE